VRSKATHIINSASHWTFVIIHHHIHANDANFASAGAFMRLKLLWDMELLVCIFLYNLFLKTNQGDKNWDLFIKVKDNALMYYAKRTKHYCSKKCEARQKWIFLIDATLAMYL
jgi:hypothetical protein